VAAGSDALGETPGADNDHGANLIRQYSGKRISATTAGLAYNLGLAHGDINNLGIRTEDPGSGGGNQAYNLADERNFDNGQHTLARYTHYKLLTNDPFTNLA
jgi:hypothetical protein